MPATLKRQRNLLTQLLQLVAEGSTQRFNRASVTLASQQLRHRALKAKQAANRHKLIQIMIIN